MARAEEEKLRGLSAPQRRMLPGLVAHIPTLARGHSNIGACRSCPPGPRLDSHSLSVEKKVEAALQYLPPIE